MLYSGSFDATVVKWGAIDGKLLSRYRGNFHQRLFHPSGRSKKLRSVVRWRGFVISAGEDWLIRGWDSSSESGYPDFVIRGHTFYVNVLFVN